LENSTGSEGRERQRGESRNKRDWTEREEKKESYKAGAVRGAQEVKARSSAQEQEGEWDG